MNIGIDCNSLFGEKKGIGFYLYHLLENYSFLSDEKDTFFLFWASSRKENPQVPSPLRKKRKIIEKKLFSFPRPIGLFLSRIFPNFPGKLLPDLDLVHFPNFTAFSVKKAKIVVTVHDLVFKLFPQTVDIKVKLSLNPFFEKSLEISDRIIAVSKSTAKDLINFFPQVARKIKVIYQGVDHGFFKPTPVGKERLLSILGTEDYFLSLSTFEPRKNLITLLKAFSILVEKAGTNAPDLVLVGSKGWKMRGFLKEFESLPEQVRKKIRFPGYLPREILPEIYSNCKCFVFPSLYEGFGLPVLEAMACGAPVIASNTSSIPEVGGDAAVYVNPRDPGAFAMEMGEILDSTSKANQLKSKSLDQSKKFSWEKTAKETLQLYKDTFN